MNCPMSQNQLVQKAINEVHHCPHPEVPSFDTGKTDHGKSLSIYLLLGEEETPHGRNGVPES